MYFTRVSKSLYVVSELMYAPHHSYVLNKIGVYYMYYIVYYMTVLTVLNHVSSIE